MKIRFYSISCACLFALAGMTAHAQELTNGTFDGDWVVCKPDGTHEVGTQPDGWMASNVYKFFIMDVKVPLVFQDTDRTEATDDTKHSVRMENLFAGMFGIGATAPGYITTGTSWAYGDISNVGTENDTSDGGSYGGVAFTNKPDAISLWVKRTHAESAPENGSFNNAEKASVIFYSWIGETSSQVRTGLSSDNPANIIDMVNRDKDVLGMLTEGVTKSDDFELVAKAEYYIEGDITEWQQILVPIDYNPEAGNPEMMNIILSSSDYFNRDQLGTGNTFTVDDVQFIYGSKLESLTIGGEAVEGFDRDTYEYDINSTELPAVGDVKAVADGQSADVEVSINEDDAQVIITVTNVGADEDGETSHVYTLQYEQSSVIGETVNYNGKLTVVMNDRPLVNGASETIEITDNGNGNCVFALRDFSIGGMLQLGDIVVDVVKTQDGDNFSYAGSVTDMSLNNGTIMCDVEIAGTEQANGYITMQITVKWYPSYPDKTSSTPINVTFEGWREGSGSAIEDPVAEDEVKVYSTSGAVVVNGYTGIVQVYNVTGSLVKNVQVDGYSTIDLRDGIYFVRTGKKAHKVIVR